MLRKSLKYAGAVLLAGFGVIQFYQPDKSNPRLNPAAKFEAVAHPATEVISVIDRACRDCHSNSTVWPWYSRVAPVSWLIADDVRKGRAHLNFSEWDRLSPEAAKTRLNKACEELKDGGMPLWQYRLIHSEARLSEQEIDNFCKAVSRVELPR